MCILIYFKQIFVKFPDLELSADQHLCPDWQTELIRRSISQGDHCGHMLCQVRHRGKLCPYMYGTDPPFINVYTPQRVNKYIRHAVYKSHHHIIVLVQFDKLYHQLTSATSGVYSVQMSTHPTQTGYRWVSWLIGLSRTLCINNNVELHWVSNAIKSTTHCFTTGHWNANCTDRMSYWTQHMYRRQWYRQAQMSITASVDHRGGIDVTHMWWAALRTKAWLCSVQYLTLLRVELHRVPTR